VRIHILTDNRVSRRGLLAEHGLSLLIEHRDRTILLDTGQTDVYLRNAVRLGLSVTETDIIVLSHGHYDHTGGLPAFPEAKTPVPVYIQANGLLPKQALNADGRTMRDIGIPWHPEALGTFGLALKPLAGSTECLPGVHLLTGIPFLHACEPEPGGFFVSTAAGHMPDHMEDEQLLVLETKRGLAVFAGCAHPGILNCLSHVRHVFPGKPFVLVMGGMHLGQADAGRVEETIRELRSMEIQQLVPLHCTGLKAICSLSNEMGALPLCAGDTVNIAD
jgi:7,8-dihydropterin-6-yl-methyl-4-(beta-D-ribofuranosyl)aminobenzene 5'-phosphate synthase